MKWQTSYITLRHHAHSNYMKFFGDTFVGAVHFSFGGKVKGAGLTVACVADTLNLLYRASTN